MNGHPRPRRPSRATVHTTVHLRPALLAEIDILANGGSRNAVLVALIEEGLRAGVQHEHAALLEAAVERTVRSALAQHIDRLGELSFRAALDSDETRRLVLTLLVSAIGVDQTRRFRREAHSASWQRLGERLAIPADYDGAWPATQAPS
jgi:hypothetical protein